MQAFNCKKKGKKSTTNKKFWINLPQGQVRKKCFYFNSNPI